MFTDGSCLSNPGPGGYACVLRSGPHERELSGGFVRTTNNRMELRAVIEGLGALRRRCRVTITTDSEYVRRGMTEWLPRWKKKGWRTAGGARGRNQDLWMLLDGACNAHEVSWQWVKGHSGHPENERCDALARAAAKEGSGIDDGFSE
ncbi:MAG: ribonuclease HI [Succinivibrionaceae bacterium]|nr:ribonuclease HI [Succinivibrionaceae bacterium]